MTRPPAAARVVLAVALPAAVLLATGACAGTGDRDPGTAHKAPASTPASRATRQSAPADPATAPALSTAQARAALVTETDLGEPWVPTEGAATWRDGYLKAKAAAGTPADCQRLLDGLYTDELLGAPPRAVVGLDDSYTGAQLRHQITAQRAADVDRTLAWLATLPEKCGEFRARTAGGTVEQVRVYDAALPDAGDARQGLRLTLTPDTGDEEETLTLDVAVARVGDDAFTVTNGGLDVVWSEITQSVTELGADRLATVRRQGRAEI
ncbi:hypothetical protein [Streptomyces sp. B93]|uniref:hypothetical protein n=1 Tax=Streptomyces sp. B93 TaxID=2824875 RepID=UPI001B36E82A|nr:hypothetical protein [Streptomyces sp. B93]MBQ1092701.1 hypothetical protein [Streptomyces sp. B93]